MDLKKLAKDALDVQDACNLSGVVISFANVIQEIRKLYPSNRDWHRHPIIKLWSDKIASLCGTQGDWDSSAAYTAVDDMAGMSMACSDNVGTKE